MKKLIFILALISLICVGCKNETATEIITVISPQEVYDAVYNSEKVQLIDVRTQDEFSEGHISSSQNVCVTDDDFKEKAAKLNKDQPVYVYCKSGGRSARAAKILKDMGFKEIYDMQGGITNWESKGLPQNN